MKQGSYAAWKGDKVTVLNGDFLKFSDSKKFDRVSSGDCRLCALCVPRPSCEVAGSDAPIVIGGLVGRDGQSRRGMTCAPAALTEVSLRVARGRCGTAAPSSPSSRPSAPSTPPPSSTSWRRGGRSCSSPSSGSLVRRGPLPSLQPLQVAREFAAGRVSTHVRLAQAPRRGSRPARPSA